MSILKGCAKLVGSVVLGATGVASSVLKGVSDTVGSELGSELFGAAKDASFNGIRSIWDSDEAQETIDKAEEASYGVEDVTRRKMAETAYRAAQIAKKNGDEEKYEQYMDKYYEYKG
ncbi:MAG: hypothetical protein IKY37_08310 [Bacteroidaceae bacterium]|nr:hypothetical protein [Bacteroidaceae bacterium]